MSTHGVFRPENEIEEALLAAVRQENVEVVALALARSDVYVPAEREGDDLAVTLLEQSGRRYVPVFTSLTQFARFSPAGGDYIRLSGRALGSVSPEGCRLALNPGGDLGLILAPDEVERASERPAPAEQPPLLVGEPQTDLAELLDAMRAFAQSEPGVRAAFRGVVARGPESRPVPVIGLELDAEKAETDGVLGEAATAARAAGIEELALVPIVAGSDPGPVGRFLREQTQPFYER